MLPALKDWKLKPTTIIETIELKHDPEKGRTEDSCSDCGTYLHVMHAGAGAGGIKTIIYCPACYFRTIDETGR